MNTKLSNFGLLAIAIVIFTTASCKKETTTIDEPTVTANIKKYETTWDAIMNKGEVDLFNTTNFDKNVVCHSSPTDIIGIDSAKAYYSQYLIGFSKIEFGIVDIFGQGDKLTKHWTFKGVHTGNFFGIPPTGKTVFVQGSTIARMKNGIIIEEQDFFDNLDLLTQLSDYIHDTPD